MKVNQQPFIPNKKLILHFDVDGVLKLPTNKNKDLYVLEAIIIDILVMCRLGLGKIIEK